VRSPFGLAAVFLSLVLAACGGGMSKEEVVREGDRICRSTTAEIDKIEEPQNVEDVKTYGPKVAKVIGAAVEDLKELDPPDEGRKDFDVFVEAAGEQASLAEQLKDAPDEDAVRALLVKSTESDMKGNAAAKAYGFKTCAQAR